jgi:hypothetical protein
MKPLAVVMVGVALLALGCNRSKETDGGSPTASASPAASSSAAEGTVASIPITEEDFEDEAERQITADNIEAELDALANEINKN